MTTTRSLTLVATATLCCASALLGCTQQPAEPAPGAPAPAEAPPAATPKSEPAPVPPAPLLASAELGKLAPDFTLSDTDGKPYTLSALQGKTVVLEWFNPDCPFIKFAHGQGELKAMAKRVMSDSLVWLSINSSAPGKQGHGVERNKAARGEYAMENPILLDEQGKVGKSYGALKTPHLFVVDAKGTLIYRGAIDNAPIGEIDPARPRLPTTKEGELINYIDTALQDVKQQRALRLPDTPPYGCSVKYQS